MLVSPFVSAMPKLVDMPSSDARHILAARAWCILRKAALNPMGRLESYLLSDIVATRFALLMETVAQIWPEPFAIHRPCCCTASIDEALIAHAIRLATLNERPHFDLLLVEMLSSDARNILFTRAQVLYV